MANLTSSSIVDGGTIEASHITALYDALTGTTVYDNISVTGTSSFALTASYAENATSDTGSLLTTASVSTNTITFTKGDASTFNITVNTGSSATSASFASTIAVSLIEDANNYNMPFIGVEDNDISRDGDGEFTYNPDTGTLTVTTLNGNATTSTSASYATTSTSASYATTATTASHAITASYALNGGGGGSTDTGSLLTTASVSSNTITFTKGDASTFNITVDTGSGGGGGGTADALVAGGELLGLTTASGHIIPSENDLYDLGSAEYKFRDLYLSSGTLYMSGSSGWMSGSWDGTNFNINNNALVKSSITSSMAVGSATTATSATTAQTATTSTNSSGFVYAGDSAQPAQLSFLAGTATLSAGTVNINAFSQQLTPNVLNQDCFITVTDTNGATGGRFTVSLSEGVITITELASGNSNGKVNFMVMYIAAG